jgi:beta-glucosidase
LGTFVHSFNQSYRFGTYSTAGAINAGLDLEMPGPTRFRGSNVEFALSSRLIKQSVLDQRVRKVLEFINRASNTKVSEKESPRDLPEDRQLNRSICANSIVLLKNDDNILPLPKKMRKLALIGSHIKTSAVSGGGSAALEPYYVVNLFDAITQKIPDVEVAFEIGAYAHKMLPLITTMLSNGIIKFYNEPFKVIDREPVAHETMNTTYFQLMDYTNNKMLHFDLFYAKMEADFTPNDTGLWDFGLTVCGTANLYLDDNLLIDNTIVQRQGQSFFGKGTTEEIRSKYLLAGKIYKLRIEFGSFKTSTIKSIGVVSFGGGGARLGACLRIDTEEAITKAVTIAADSDYAVICTGLSVSKVNLLLYLMFEGNFAHFNHVQS